ncbi:MAG: efflux transporter outer membrane subunit [Prevotella sp.]|jgi:NodT family efflux transporter outer membrane factor (OMF) lipoprotein|nr:efflux transporter outer membrane subunit [Prevotella sp.]
MNKKYFKGIAMTGIILSVGLSSCQFANKYKAPEIDSDKLYRDYANTSDTTTIANIPWRTYFSDPQLQTLIDEALEKNYDMLVIAERVKQAEAALGMARAAYFPNIALMGQVEQTRSSVNPANGETNVLAYHTEQYRYGVSASWELDVWGKLNRQQRARYADVLNSYAGQNLLKTSLISNIAMTYYSLLALDEQLRITTESEALMKESVSTIQALMKAGLQNGAAVEQMKASLYSLQASIPDLESSIRKLENTLCLLTGKKPGDIRRGKLSAQAVPETLAAGVPFQMLAKRPDVRQAELAFRSAFEMTNAAQASFYPSISISSAMVGFVGDLKPENIFASIIGSITQPIFAKKQLLTQYKVAKAEQQAALLNFEKAVLTAGKEVSDILFTFNSSLKKNEVRAKQVESLNKAVNYTHELLKAGEANYLEVISAEQNLLQAQISQVNDKLQQLQAASDLYKALGGGVE